MANESICRGCFHSYVCEQFNEHRNSNNQKCHFCNDHFVSDTDVVEVVPELRKAVKMLHKEYAKAKQNPVVRDHLAYALYQTWRFFDDRKNGR